MKMPIRQIALAAFAPLAVVAAASADAEAGPRYRWHGHRPYWSGAAIAAEVASGLALGAAIASSYAYRPYPTGCSWQNRPTFDAWGHFVGYRSVQVCD